jgi:hypothetical protein
MRRFGWCVIAFAAGLVTMGCAEKAQQSNGNALTAAGFRMVLADTPQLQASLRQLPPQKFVRKLRGDKVAFIYADPANCNCAYVGNVTTYAAYQAHLARQEQAVTTMDDWDFSPWAFGYPD